MPEAPEVDLMCSWINRELNLGAATWSISEASVVRENGKYFPGDELDRVCGRIIRRIYRRGKYMIFVLDEGYIVCHNAMSGYWDTQSHPWTFDYVEGKRKATESDVRVTMKVSHCGPDRGSDLILRFHDARLFGSLRYSHLYPLKVPPISHLGPEVVFTQRTMGFDFEVSEMDDDHLLLATCKRRNANLTIKEFLMDQRNIAGVGNIYSSETLYKAGIRPDRPVRNVPENSFSVLTCSLREQILNAIARNVDYSSLQVYRKYECSKCLVPIEKIDISGRSSYFCPICQK
jgi:formamidopyrimidine-DNA glycosylase